MYIYIIDSLDSSIFLFADDDDATWDNWDVKLANQLTTQQVY